MWKCRKGGPFGEGLKEQEMGHERGRGGVEGQRHGRTEHCPKKQRPGVSPGGHLWSSSLRLCALDEPPEGSRESPPSQASPGPYAVGEAPGFGPTARLVPSPQKVREESFIPFGFLGHSLFLPLE